MSAPVTISVEKLKHTFTQAIIQRKGEVVKTTDSALVLSQEAKLPTHSFVQEDDVVQGGIAFLLTPESLSLNHYVFRVICKNGMLSTENDGPYAVWDLLDERKNADDILHEFKQAIINYQPAPHFQTIVSTLKNSLSVDVPLIEAIINLSIRKLSQSITIDLVENTVEEDETLFGLINAITATARDTENPIERYLLQNLAGQITQTEDYRPFCIDSAAELADQMEHQANQHITEVSEKIRYLKSA